MIKAVIFDLVGTLAFVKERVDNKKVSSFLVSNGYEVYPQQLTSAFSFVVFIDYPKFGFDDYESMLKKMFERLEVEVDELVFKGVVRLYEKQAFEPYSDSEQVVRKVKDLGLKTAIATTTPRFWFEKDLKPILSYIDFICTGYEAGCEKSNPKMYKRILKRLKVSPPETMVIGDNIELDVLIPKKLGIKTILLNRNGKSRRSLEPDISVSNLKEAIKWIVCT